jgi:hypothetical protein
MHARLKYFSSFLILLLVTVLFVSCEASDTLKPSDTKKDSITVSTPYIDQHENFGDDGQYWIPKQKTGTEYWIVTNANSNTNDNSANCLKNHLLAESIIGLTSLAVNENRGETMVWTDISNQDYTDVRDNQKLIYKGTATTWQLLANPDIKKQINGYVLCSLANEESVTVATIAAHVYRSVIVDISYENQIKSLGYSLKYNAVNKSLSDGWAEFKDSCNNDALILMPTLTGNLKSFAIAHRLMVVNYDKSYESASSGNNNSLFTEILNWLKPLSPVIGWEQNVPENTFVDLVSQSGNMMIAADWTYNLTFMSANYENNQSGLVKVTNPKYIDYNDTMHYTSFFLTDGDNVQWMMNNFRNSTYYLNGDNPAVKMSYGLPFCNLSMMAPFQLSRLISEQAPESSLMEFCGGGYYYADDFGVNKGSLNFLSTIAQKVAHHMRQHSVKVLGLFCLDVNSDQAKNAYQAYISNNDQLVGIIAIQYSPYTGGNGNIMWFKNSKEYYIPVVTTRYSIWNSGTNGQNQGTPAYIAGLINTTSSSIDAMNFSLVDVHAWSAFSDSGTSTDLLSEDSNGEFYGATPAKWCMNRLKSNIKVVNVEELLWQIRMHYRPEQTKEILAHFY